MHRGFRASVVAWGALWAGVASAEPCKGIRVQEDRFGDGQMATAHIQRLNQFRAVGIALKRTGDGTTLHLTVKEAGALTGAVPPGTQLSFRFDNGHVLKLATDVEVPLQSYASGSQFMTNVPYALPLEPAQLDTFASHTLEAVRVPIQSRGTTHDWDVNRRAQKRLQRAAACLKGL